MPPIVIRCTLSSRSRVGSRTGDRTAAGPSVSADVAKCPDHRRSEPLPSHGRHGTPRQPSAQPLRRSLAAATRKSSAHLASSGRGDFSYVVMESAAAAAAAAAAVVARCHVRGAAAAPVARRAAPVRPAICSVHWNALTAAAAAGLCSVGRPVGLHWAADPVLRAAWGPATYLCTLLAGIYGAAGWIRASGQPMGLWNWARLKQSYRSYSVSVIRSVSSESRHVRKNDEKRRLKRFTYLYICLWKQNKHISSYWRRTKHFTHCVKSETI